jgi:hypothetical protein
METRHLIIFESSMNSRFIELSVENNMEYTCFNMENSLKEGILLAIVNRIANRNDLKNKLRSFMRFVEENKIEQVYLSNTEGYIGCTGSKFLKSKCPEVEFIALQHGIFPLEINFFKNSLIKIINKISFFCFGICVLGEGFGSVLLDKYIVYGNAEKSFLINSRNWNNKNIEVNLKFLKSYLLKGKKIDLNKTKVKQNSAILLLQSLASAKICSVSEELILIEQTINYLSLKFEKVLLKEHPFCKNRIKNIKLPANVEVIEDMIDGFQNSIVAYSYFSTALIDAKFFNLKAIAIYSSMFKMDKSVYKIFDNIISFEKEIENK